MGAPLPQPWTGNRSVVPVDASFVSAIRGGAVVEFSVAPAADAPRMRGQLVASQTGPEFYWNQFDAQGRNTGTREVRADEVEDLVHGLVAPELLDMQAMLDAVAGIERVRLSAQLSAAVGRLSGITGDGPMDAIKRVRAASEVSALIARMTGGPSPASDAIDPADMLNPSKATKVLLKALRGLKDAPRHEQIAAATYAGAIWESARFLRESAARLGVNGGSDFDQQQFDELQAEASAMVGDHATTVDECIKRGSLGEELRAELAGMSGAGEAISAERKRLIGDYTEKIEHNYAIYRRMIQSASDLPTIQQRAEARAEASAFFDREVNPLQNERGQKIDELNQKFKALYAESGRKIADRVLAQSSVTEDDAVKWARAQEITPTAKARLRKIGYSVASVVADMAEFYRMIGGRLKRVRIDSKGDRRANATDIEAHGKVGTVNLDSKFSRLVLWHELGHHMEADPVAKAAAGRFLKMRSVDGGKTYSLRSMTGSKFYGRNEVAINGGFFSPYVGKIYGDGATEVFSMGIETLSDPAILAQRALADPQTIEFVTGFLMGARNPLSAVHMELRDMITSMDEEHRDNQADRAAGAVKALADSVELIEDKDRSWMDGNWIFQSYVEQMEQVGRIGGDAIDGGRYVFSGKVKNERGRMVSGFVMAWFDGAGIRRASYPTKDINMVKALMAIYQQRGFTPSLSDLQSAEFLQRYAA